MESPSAKLQKAHASGSGTRAAIGPDMEPLKNIVQRAKAHARADASALGKNARAPFVDLKQGYDSIRRRLA